MIFYFIYWLLGTHKCNLGPGELNIHPEMRSKLEIDSTLYSRVACHALSRLSHLYNLLLMEVQAIQFCSTQLHRPKDYRLFYEYVRSAHKSPSTIVHRTGMI